MLMKDIEVFMKKKNKKRVNIIANTIKIFLKVKKKITECRRNYYITHKKQRPRRIMF